MNGGSGIPLKLRAQILEREKAMCLRCGAWLVGRLNYSIHHRRPRMMGGTSDPRVNDPRNLVAVCGSGVTGCHGWIERCRNEARDKGWLIGSFDDLERELISMYGASIRLHADLTVTIQHLDRRRRP